MAAPAAAKRVPAPGGGFRTINLVDPAPSPPEAAEPDAATLDEQPDVPMADATAEPVASQSDMRSGSVRMRELIELLRPAEAEVGDVPTEASRIDEMLSPTLLPSLIFQDLVFGNELGAGTFAKVKYAKRVRRVSQSTIRWY